MYVNNIILLICVLAGSGQNKLQTLFRMFDHDRNGSLERDELIKLFR